MGIFDALKGFFGVSKHTSQPLNGNDQEYSSSVNYFIKPDWANEDEDSDDDLVMRSPSSNFTFSVFSNPLEIHRYFEQQMNEMAKQFEDAFSTESGLKNNGLLDSFFGQTPFFNADQTPAILPPTDNDDRSSSLRDKCLKPDARKRHPAVDSDLDNEFKNGQLALFKSPEVPQAYVPSEKVFSSQVFTRIIRRPDGSMEEVRTKQVGDQKYTKIIRTDSEGHRNIHEDIVNIDEDKLKDFQSLGENALPKLDFKDWLRFRL